MLKNRIIFFMLIALSMIGLPIHAEIIAGFSGNSGAPITIHAEELAIDHKSGQAIFSGQVEAVQSGQKLKARHMNVVYDLSPADIRFLHASGNVHFIGRERAGQEAPHAHGDLAEYNVSTRKLILSGSVVLRRGQHIVKGQSLIIDLVTGQSLMDSTQKGLPGRVRGLIKGSQKPEAE